MAPLRFDTTVADGVALIVLDGELDLSGAARLQPEIERLAGDAATHTVVLDLRGLEFLDSSGLRLVAIAERVLADAGTSLALVRGPETVQRVFDITRMTERLTFADSPEAAAAGGQAEPA